MPLYENRDNAENVVTLSAEARDKLEVGTKKVISRIVRDAHPAAPGTVPFLALDGYYGVDWPGIETLIAREAERQGTAVQFFSSRTFFRPQAELASIKKPYITDDPGFGCANLKGRLSEIVAPAGVAAFTRARDEALARGTAVILTGPGAAYGDLCDQADRVYYFDKTRQPLLWQMWDGELVPFGADKPDPDYSWKEYYYYDFYLLHHHKNELVTRMDYWVEGITASSLKLVPRDLYDTIMSTLVRQPVKEVKIFQPGPWGAYRYKDFWDVPGLECNAWNELAGPELSMLVKVEGTEEPLNMPAMNLMQYGEQFVGPWINEHLPQQFPLDVWLDDGYFPIPEPAERISMPIHNHPGTDYVKRRFNEPLGRYETYYIAEAYEGANTWMGYTEEANLEEWERKCRDSNNLKEIPDWKDYIANWSSVEGDLYLIPPGTTHGHGGNQMILEMDTCPSIAGTEYSFFAYDFARNSWDDKSKTMTAGPLKMHLDHAFDNEKWYRASWVRDNLRARPEVIQWDRDFVFERYASLPEMPFEIERCHFPNRALLDTQGRYMHIVTLTVGENVKIRSETDPGIVVDIDLFQSAIVPACFGSYEFLNECGGRATVVILRWKQG